MKLFGFTIFEKAKKFQDPDQLNLFGNDFELFNTPIAGQTKQFGENDVRKFDAQKHRWVDADEEKKEQSAAVKEPYEMTRGEFVKTIKPGELGSYEYARILKYDDNENQTVASAKHFIHKYIVEQALKEGKKVPEEVLKDYPDLAEKYKKEHPTPKEAEPETLGEAKMQTFKSGSIEAKIEKMLRNKVTPKKVQQTLDGITLWDVERVLQEIYPSGTKVMYEGYEYSLDGFSAINPDIIIIEDERGNQKETRFDYVDFITGDEVKKKVNTLDELAELVVAGEIKNQDQAIADFIESKYPNLTQDERDEKFLTAVRNFETHLYKIKKKRSGEQQPRTMPKRNIWYPKMTKSRLERLLAKEKLTDNDKEDLLDYKYLLLFEQKNAYDKGLMDVYSTDNGDIYIPKNKYWITNIDNALGDYQSKYNAESYERKRNSIIVEDVNNGKIVNDIYDEWFGVNNKEDFEKWAEKVRNTRFGTYKNQSILSFIEQKGTVDKINEVHKNTFLNDLAIALHDKEYLDKLNENKQMTLDDLPKPKREKREKWTDKRLQKYRNMTDEELKGKIGKIRRGLASENQQRKEAAYSALRDIGRAEIGSNANINPQYLLELVDLRGSVKGLAKKEYDDFVATYEKTRNDLLEKHRDEINEGKMFQEQFDEKLKEAVEKNYKTSQLIGRVKGVRKYGSGKEDHYDFVRGSQLYGYLVTFDDGKIWTVEAKDKEEAKAKAAVYRYYDGY